MNFRRICFLALALLLAPLPGRAAVQDFDPVKSATGWASFDRDGSCVFFDPGTRRLLSWGRDTGITQEVYLTRMSLPAEKWVLDPMGNAWVVAGTTLQFVDKTGKLGTSYNLPAEVVDLAWDTRSFLLCYRTKEPYLERRDMKNGSVMWSFGTKPPKGGAFIPALHHVAIREDGLALLSSGDKIDLVVLDITKGTRLDTLTFTLNGQPAPRLNLGDGNRGALAWWMNNNVALMAIPSSQCPPGEYKGLVLAKLDLTKGGLTLIPTPFDDHAALVGILDNSAVLRSPSGGLTFFPIP